MIGLKDILVSEVKKGFATSGLTPDVNMIGNELVITIAKDDIVKILMSGFPEQYRSALRIEASDIKIYIKVM